MVSKSIVIAFPGQFYDHDVPLEGIHVDSQPLVFPQRVDWGELSLDEFLGRCFTKRAHRVDGRLVLEMVDDSEPVKTGIVFPHYRAWGAGMVFEANGSKSEPLLATSDYLVRRINAERVGLVQAAEYAVYLWTR